MKYILLVLTLVCVGCGKEVPSQADNTDNQIGEINSKLSALTLVAGNLTQIINSDFATCPASGDTADALIRKICEVAQASTVEVRVELQNQIGVFANQLQNEINSNSTDLAAQQAQLDTANQNIAANSAAIASINTQVTAINATVTNLQSSVLTLQTQMTSANAAIAALQTLTNSITGTLNGAMISLSIGEENVAAGPLYEAALRRVDKTRFNGFVSAYGAYQSFGANPVTATNASASAVFALTSHGYSSGDLIELSGLTSGRGFLTGDVTGRYTIASVTTNTFTLTLPRAATQAGTLGGSNGLVRKVNGEGMATLWKSSDASDVAVRVTNAGSKAYNFIIRRISTDLTNATAELCYDKSNASASFATINAASAGGSGNIVCK